MKKQKVIAMLLAGTLTLVQPLSAIASESEFYSEDANAQETVDALPETLEDSPIEDITSTTEESVSDFADIEDAGFLDAAAAVGDQYAGFRRDLFTQLFNRAFAKQNAGWGMQVEIIHCLSPPKSKTVDRDDTAAR